MSPEQDFLDQILGRVVRQPPVGAVLSTDVLGQVHLVGMGTSARVQLATVGAAATPVTSAAAMAGSELYELDDSSNRLDSQEWQVEPIAAVGEQARYLSTWSSLGLQSGDVAIFPQEMVFAETRTISNSLMAGESHPRIEFAENPKLPARGSESVTPSQKAGVSKLTKLAVDILHGRLILDGVYPGLRREDVVLVEYQNVRVLRTIASAILVQVHAVVDAVGGEAEKFVVPATRIELNDPLDPTWDVADNYTIHYNLVRTGRIFPAPAETIDYTAFESGSPVTGPGVGPQGNYAIVGADGSAALFAGAVLSTGSELRFLATDFLQGDPEYKLPAKLYGPLVEATRGETVTDEVLGSGDATVAFQSFTLRKSPLTYLADPSAPGGRRSSLQVFVNGKQWRQAQSFYGARSSDQIYVVSHGADNRTTITFGDGEFGSRLPSGIDNVVASYRHGVGGNVDANAITAFKRPIKGIRKVFNPLPASGGELPPNAAAAREQAIQSTRVLGRLVSLLDFEVEAARFGGVMQARASWAWDELGEDAVIHVDVVTAEDGDPSEALRCYLLGLAEPDVQVVVHHAQALVGAFELDLEIEPRYQPDAVAKAVLERLFHPFDGIFALRNVSIGGYIHRSRLYAEIHAVEGVLGVNEVMVNKIAMPVSIRLGAGQYLDLLDEPMSVNGLLFSADVDGRVTRLPPNLALPVPPVEDESQEPEAEQAQAPNSGSLVKQVWIAGKWTKPKSSTRKTRNKPKRARGKAPLPVARAGSRSQQLDKPLGMKE